jgi:hypothetical protein
MPRHPRVSESGFYFNGVRENTNGVSISEEAAKLDAVPQMTFDFGHVCS